MKTINKIINALLFIIISNTSFAQANKNLEINISDESIVQLIFDRNVNDYKISNEEVIEIDYSENAVTLKAIGQDLKNIKCNLIIRLEDNSIYSFIVKFQEDIDEFLYFIKKEQSQQSLNLSPSKTLQNQPNTTPIKSESPKNKGEKKNEKIDVGNLSTIADKSNYLANTDGYIRSRNLDSNKGIYSYLRGVYVDTDKLYFFYEIDNKTNINYDIDNYIFITEARKKKGNALEANEIEFSPIHVSGDFKNIPANSGKKIVFVFDKFTIDQNKFLKFIINEKNGERTLNNTIIGENIASAKLIK